MTHSVMNGKVCSPTADLDDKLEEPYQAPINASVLSRMGFDDGYSLTRASRRDLLVYNRPAHVAVDATVKKNTLRKNRRILRGRGG